MMRRSEQVGTGRNCAEGQEKKPAEEAGRRRKRKGVALALVGVDGRILVRIDARFLVNVDGRIVRNSSAVHGTCQSGVRVSPVCVSPVYVGPVRVGSLCVSAAA